jgi:hypothetical protein
LSFVFPGKPALRKRFAEHETDPHRLAQRQKQIDFGKNTLGYAEYRSMIPKSERRRGDPVTPDITIKMPKRRFVGLVRKWRRQLHFFDPAHADLEESPRSGEDLESR